MRYKISYHRHRHRPLAALPKLANAAQTIMTDTHGPRPNSGYAPSTVFDFYDENPLRGTPLCCSWRFGSIEMSPRASRARRGAAR